ncbi:wall-associated receptor kinase 2-like [Quercus suber]|uniref:wall-associated receptor kinase 2-like n=1 Tax=Quercus suber TaxID=58331 RepID=UPI0032DEFF3E
MALCGVLLKQQILLLLGLIVLAATKASQPNSSCGNVSCGNVSIPFPFGTEKGCYLNESFLITCDNTSETTPKPFLSYTKVPVLNISLDGELQVSISKARRCSKGVPENTSEFRADNTLSNFHISYTRNKFIAVGCNIFGFFDGYSSQGKKYPTGCAALCDNDSVVDTSECSGIGCCQAPIPKGVSGFSVNFWDVEQNNVVATNLNSCDYGLVTEETYNISLLRQEILQNRTTFPMVLDWAVGDETCEDAKGNSESYACKAENSTCYNSTNGPGYRCNCSSGFEGNPYLVHGCKDIDECQNSPSPCAKNEICTNLHGDYKCSCKKGYEQHTSTTGCHRVSQSKDIIIALCISIISLLVVLLGGSWILWGWKRRKHIRIKEKFFQQNGGLLLKQQLSSKQWSIETTKIFTSEELKKATNNYDENTILGQGGYGTVYKGKLSDNRVVAIKKSKIGDQSQIQQFINEVIVLTQISHRNVVKLFGCCLETEVPLLVYEFITNGTLCEHIHDKGRSSLLSWEKRLKIATETAEALAYLHSATSMPIIHRDVKTANILLDDNYTAKVADFGASRLVPLDQTQLTTLVQGTLGYLDPEYLQTSQLTEKSDVYSFGVVMAELLTGKKALSFDRPEIDRNLAISFVSAIKEDRLLQILETHIVNEGNMEQLKEVSNVAKRCLKLRGEDRPSMKEVATELEGLKSMEKYSLGSIDANTKKTEYLLSATSHSFEIEGCSTSTAAEYDSMKDQLLKLVDNGR